ncbi:MAG TPA: NUDIX domain-containing protein [Aliidongia sp.]|nr:NUDIX domain-containing protein [Aliidongia sp.]
MEECFTLVAEERRHDGFLKLDRYAVRQRRFDGTETPILDREVVTAAECVGVLLYDPARDTVVLIEQARLPPALMGLPAVQVEIVAGRIEAGDTPIAAVHREVREETGCTILGEPEQIAVALTSPGYNTERIHLYCALVDSSAAGGFHGLAAEHEDIRVLALPYERFAEWQAAGRIMNLFTLHAGLWLALHRERLRRG